jgi:hypothetical protein
MADAADKLRSLKRAKADNFASYGRNFGEIEIND